MACIRTPEPLQRGRRLLVELSLPDGQRVEAIGRVAWAKHPMRAAPTHGQDCGVGIEFLGGAADQLRALDEFLTRGARGEADH